MMPRTRTRSAGSDHSQGESYSHGGSKLSRPNPAEKSKFYAGAKFDTVPSLSVLPPPPRHWTDPAARSQSTPSSPVTIPTKPSAGVSIDMGSLFGPRPQPSCDKGHPGAGGIFKSASLPAQSGMLKLVAKREVKANPSISITEPRVSVFKTPQNKKVRPTVKDATKPKPEVSKPLESGEQVTPKSTPVTPIKQGSSVQGISGRDLMEMLLRASPTNRQDLLATPSASVNKSPVKVASPCHLQLGSPHNQYKEVSDHLKSILKVSA